MTYNIDAAAKALIASITAGVNFDVVEPDFSGTGYNISDLSLLSQTITPLTNASLTTGTVDGNGTFDIIMKAFSAHLGEEYEKGRITGAEYSKVYVSAMGAAINGAVQYLLSRDAATMQAINAQIAAISANVALVTAKAAATTQIMSAHTARANYGLTLAQIAGEDIKFAHSKYQLENLLPLQKTLLTEQVNTQRAQTIDTRTDGTNVTGSLGAQRALYNQQVVSYKRDSEYKLGKLFVDSWVTNRTIDDSIPTPAAFGVTNISDLLTKLRVNNDLD